MYMNDEFRAAAVEKLPEKAHQLSAESARAEGRKS